MSWCDYSISSAAQQYFYTEDMNISSRFDPPAVQAVPSKWEVDHAWYYELMAQDEEDECAQVATQSDIPHASTKQINTSMPRSPSVPRMAGRQEPYFEYMFADAGLEDYAAAPSQCVFENEDAMDGIEEHDTEATTPVEFGPATPPQVAEIMPAVFVQDHSAAILTCDPEDSTTISEQHTLLRQLPTRLGDLLPTPFLDFSIPEPDDVLASENEHETIREVLKPKSQKAKAAKSWMRAALSLACQPMHSQPKRLVEAPSAGDIKVGKKRAARSSLTPPNPFSSEDESDYDQTSTYKKPRISRNLELNDIEAIFSALPSAPFTKSRNTSRSISDDFFKGRCLPIAPKGYAGQFEGMFIDRDNHAVFSFQPHNPHQKVHNPQTFGYKPHPNGVFTHSYFRADDVAETPDYTERQVHRDHPLITCMSFATEMTAASCHPNITALRTRDEEMFRRGVHVECTAARLEGVAVGFFRYLQGHYSIEEYHQAGMCICWDLCQCSKMCTRYGDLKCPCNGDIIVHSDG